MSFEQLIHDMNQLLVQLKASLMIFLPKLIIAIVILLIGILIARLFRALVNRLTKTLERIISNKKIHRVFKQVSLERSVSLVGKIVYWIIIIFFVTIATEVMNLPIITTWLSGLVHYLPNILIAVIIVVIGVVGGRLLQNLIATSLSTTGLLYGNMLGKIVQYAILLITILIAVDQIGIDIAALTGAMNVILAAILFGAALAFGLGARTSVSNILASYYLQSRYREGQTVKIREIEGKIIQITSTAVILKTVEGEVTVPVVDENNIFLGVIRYEALKRIEKEIKGSRPAHQAGAALGELFRIGLSGMIRSTTIPMLDLSEKK